VSLRPLFPFVAAAVLAAAAVPVDGQSPVRRPGVAVTGGISQYDLSGTGTRKFAAMRVQVPVLSHLVIEPGLGFMDYRIQGQRPAPRARLWFPEVQVQAEAQLGPVRPYLGAGGGLAVESLLGERGTEPTLSAAGGARIDLPGNWGLEGELRIRAIDPWTGTTADWGISVITRL
jgi:hypothetical protein